jgi:oligosaccharide repeat unit polymerase
VFEPKLIFAAIWILEIIFFLSVPEEFHALDVSTWLIIVVAQIAFFVGASLSYASVRNTKIIRTQCYSDYHFVRKCFLLLLLVYFALGTFSINRIIEILGLQALFGGDLASLRNAVIKDFIGERELFSYTRVFGLGVAISILAIAHGRYFNAFERNIFFAVGLISAVATTGRLYLLMFALASAFLLFRQKIVGYRGLLLGGGGFLVFFFSIAFLTGKGEQESGTVASQLIWNVKVYLFSSLACLNDFVVTGNQEFEGGLLVPGPIRTLLNFLGFTLPAKPDLMPFSWVPIQCNTYTALYPLFHDLGLVGVAAGLAAIGYLHGYLWRTQNRVSSPDTNFIYAISLYPLFMSIFEDAYFSSPGFWVVTVSPLVAVRLLRLIFGCKLKYNVNRIKYTQPLNPRG